MMERLDFEEHDNYHQEPSEIEDEAGQIAPEQAWSALKQCRRELRQILAIMDAALSTLALDELVSTLLNRVREFVRADSVTLLLREGEELVVQAASGVGAEANLGARISISTGFAGRVAKGRRPLAMEDISRSEARRLGPVGKGVRALLGVPLLLDGAVLGVLQAGMRTPRNVAAEDLRLLQLVAMRAARAIHRAQLFEEVRRSEQRFRALVEATREYAIILLDPEGRVLDWNSGAEQLFQYAPTEIQGLHFSRFFTPDDLARGRPEWELQTAAGGGRARDDNWLVRKDGTRFWVTGVTTALRDETGQLWGYAKVVRDQTEQKLAEEAEWRAAREIEDLYNNAPCGYHSLDAGGRFNRINDTELRWLGYDRSELLGREFADFLAPEYRQVFQEQFPRFKACGWVRDLELELVRRDGSSLPVLLSSTAVYDVAGRFVMSRSTLFDMTERKYSESVTRTQQQTLVELAKNPTLASGDLHHALRLITAASASALDVAGVGVWIFTEGPETLRAADYYHRDANEHSPEVDLSGAAPGAYLRALEAERVLAVSDVRSNPRLLDLWKFEFLPDGITSMLVAPVRLSGHVVGMVQHDHVGPPRSWTLEEQGFAGSVADLVAQAIEGADRRAMEEALRARSAAVEASIDGMAILDREGRFTFVNQAHAHLHGYDRPEQLLGKSWKDLCAPEELRRFEEEILPALARDGQWRGEVEGQRYGRPYTQELSLTTVPEGGMICVLRDITLRKKAEAEVRFLADAGAVLTASLGFEETLQQVAQLVVSCLADLCIIDLIEENGSISRPVVVHADPAWQYLAEQLRLFPPDPDIAEGVPKALRTAVPQLMSEVQDATLRATAQNAEHLALLRELHPRSALVQPLSARGRVVGAITLAYTEPPRQYGPQDLVVAGELARRAAMAIDNARLYEHQKTTAWLLQQSLLPAALPEVPGLEWAASYHPAGEGLEVGGDFYDVYRDMGNGGIVMVMGDVSGKGVVAATVTALTRHTARAVTMYDLVPSHVLSKLNYAIIEQGKGLFVTTIFACLGQPANDATGERTFTFACGGHLPPLRLRPNGMVEPLGQPGMLLGYFSEPQFPDCVVTLEPGDVVLFYTDGVTEARRQRELYGEERLAALLAACRGLAPQQIVERIEQTVLEFQGGQPRDDIAILALRILPYANS